MELGYLEQRSVRPPNILVYTWFFNELDFRVGSCPQINPQFRRRGRPSWAPPPPPAPCFLENASRRHHGGGPQDAFRGRFDLCWRVCFGMGLELTSLDTRPRRPQSLALRRPLRPRRGLCSAAKGLLKRGPWSCTRLPAPPGAPCIHRRNEPRL